MVPASEALGLTAGIMASGQIAWDISAAVGYDKHYLAGFRAALPAFGIDNALERALPAVERNAQVLASNERPWSRVEAGEIIVDEVRCKLVLLPVWLGRYEIGGKRYCVAVNGQSGRVGIEIPVSRSVRIFELALGIVVTLFAATALILAILGIAGIA